MPLYLAYGTHPSDQFYRTVADIKERFVNFKCDFTFLTYPQFAVSPSSVPTLSFAPIDDHLRNYEHKITKLYTKLGGVENDGRKDFVMKTEEMLKVFEEGDPPMMHIIAFYSILLSKNGLQLPTIPSA